VRLVRRADGYYVQFCIQVDREEVIEPTHRIIGLDVGLESFYTDSLGNKVENPRFYRHAYCRWWKPATARRVIEPRIPVSKETGIVKYSLLALDRSMTNS
jgi:transposase